MMATAVTESEKLEGPGLETGGTANLTTTAQGCMAAFVKGEWGMVKGEW
jgi:hypothetical protein